MKKHSPFLLNGLLSTWSTTQSSHSRLPYWVGAGARAGEGDGAGAGDGYSNLDILDVKNSEEIVYNINSNNV